MSFSEIVLFVGLGGVVGFAGGLFAIEGALIAIPVANRRVRLHPTRLAGNGAAHAGPRVGDRLSGLLVGYVRWEDALAWMPSRSRRSGRGRHWP